MALRNCLHDAEVRSLFIKLYFKKAAFLHFNCNINYSFFISSSVQGEPDEFLFTKNNLAMA